MHGDARSDDEIQLAARCLFKGVVPERSAELIKLWKQYQPKFHLLSDAGPDGVFVMAAGRYRDVVFNHRALRAFWLAAFIAWEGYMRVHELATNGSADFDRFDHMVDIFSRILDRRRSVKRAVAERRIGTWPLPRCEAISSRQVGSRAGNLCHRLGVST